MAKKMSLAQIRNLVNKYGGGKIKSIKVKKSKFKMPKVKRLR